MLGVSFCLEPLVLCTHLVGIPDPNRGRPTMKVAIIGGTGFVGLHITRQLLASGHVPRKRKRSKEKRRRK